METLQIDQKFDSRIGNHGEQFHKKTQLSWRDIQGLTWIIEDDY